MRPFLAFSGVSLIVAGTAYLAFPHAATGLTGMNLPTAAAVIDARATYGGLQVGLGVFLLACRARQDRARTGLVQIVIISTGLALARLYGFAVDGAIDWFNALGVAVEAGFAAVAGTLLRSSRPS